MSAVDSSSFHHKFVNKGKNVSRPPAARREWGDAGCGREGQDGQKEGTGILDDGSGAGPCSVQ